jgi:hypothetical protein
LLEKACREERGLNLALVSMDPASSETTRELADEALEELLEHPHVLEFIENRLFSKRLPEDALWRGKQTIDGSRPNVKVEILKRSVTDAQEAIGRVRAAWDTLPEDLFTEAENRADFESVLEETGAFRVLAMAVAETRKHSGGEVQQWLFSDRRFQTIANAHKILVEWISVFPGVSRVGGQLAREQRDDAQEAGTESAAARGAISAAMSLARRRLMGVTRRWRKAPRRPEASSGLLPGFLLPETTIREAGAGPDVNLGDSRGGPILLTLGITRIVEQESLDVSIWGSADNVEWGAKPIVSFPQKFYCGTYQILVDLRFHPEVQFLRVKYKPQSWGKGKPKPLFGAYVFAQGVQPQVLGLKLA